MPGRGAFHIDLEPFIGTQLRRSALKGRAVLAGKHPVHRLREVLRIGYRNSGQALGPDLALHDLRNDRALSQEHPSEPKYGLPGPLGALIFLSIGITSIRRLAPEASSWQAWSSRSLWFVAGGLLLAFLVEPIRAQRVDVVSAARDCFGAVRVFEFDEGSHTHRRSLWHGPVSHGEQFLQPGRQLQATTYYGPESGVGLALRFHPLRSAAGSKRSSELRGLRVRVIGLGAGTIAAYGRSHDRFRFYEISPSVVEISRKYFSFLSGGQGWSEMVLGDARIALENERMRNQKQGFDVLAIDAFTGGSVPVHLLTKEAFEVYFEHLLPDGVLAVRFR